MTGQGKEEHTGLTWAGLDSCAEGITMPKITLNPLHSLWELPQEIKVWSDRNIRYQTLLQVGTAYDVTYLGTSADTTLTGSEIFIQSNEVVVTMLKSFYFTLQQSCCTTRIMGCSGSSYKVPGLSAALAHSCNFSPGTYSRDRFPCHSNNLISVKPERTD